VSSAGLDSVALCALGLENFGTFLNVSHLEAIMVSRGNKIVYDDAGQLL
jgi:hypothetical protein